MEYKLPAPTWFDRTIAAIWPQRGVDRMRWRAQWQFSEVMRQRGIELPFGTRGRGDWSNLTQSPDAAMGMAREATRNVVRDLILNNPYAAGAVQRRVANIVGRGIKPQCALQEDTAENEPFRKPEGWGLITERDARRFATEAEALFAEFSEGADITGRCTFYGLQSQIERMLDGADGEAFVHITRAPRNGRRPVGFAIEVIEGDRVSTPAGKIADPNIRDGIEMDPETGEPIAVWVQKRHPGDNRMQVLNKHERIPIYMDAPFQWLPQMIHLFEPLRPGQTRASSPYTPCLGVFQDLHKYWEAEIMAARVGACYSAFVTSPFTPGIKNIVSQAREGAKAGEPDREETLMPGMIWYGQPGESITFGNPTRPNSQFSTFTETLLRAIGVCLELPFELIALDFSKTNYSSARASLLEARRSFQRRQGFLISHLCRTVWAHVVVEGVLSGRLDAPYWRVRRKDYLASTWTPPSWGWVDPVKEEVAARESIRGFLSTHSDELAAQGRDFDETAERCAREHKRFKELGLPSPWDALESGQKLLSADAAKNKETADAISAE